MPANWVPLVIGLGLLILTAIVLIVAPKRKTYRAAIIDQIAYWQDGDKWWKAPAYDGEIIFSEKEEIDIYATDQEEIDLLLRIVERFET